jgi:hypothetical protein
MSGDISRHSPRDMRRPLTTGELRSGKNVLNDFLGRPRLVS